uniref:Uncharacterized protein n=1 Tax=Megaselia scalaris TaxID=36166 RepID=T1GYW7_MEGSC
MAPMAPSLNPPLDDTPLVPITLTLLNCCGSIEAFKASCKWNSFVAGRAEAVVTKKTTPKIVVNFMMKDIGLLTLPGKRFKKPTLEII